MLRVDHLRKSFGSLVAVDDVSLSLAGGQLVGLLGPNGAGKTTTVSMIAGLVTPERGEVLVGGQTPAGRHAIRPSGASASCRRTWRSTTS